MLAPQYQQYLYWTLADYLARHTASAPSPTPITCKGAELFIDARPATLLNVIGRGQRITQPMQVIATLVKILTDTIEYGWTTLITFPYILG